MTDEATAHATDDKSSPEARLNGLMRLANERLKERNAALEEAQRLKAELAKYRSDPNGDYWQRDRSGLVETEPAQSEPESDEGQDEEMSEAERAHRALQREVNPRLMVPATPNRSMNSEVQHLDELEQARSNFRRAYDELKSAIE